jgi:hypothetical protein
MYKLLLILLVLISGTGCKSLINQGNSKMHKVTVVDAAYLSGCRWLLRTEDGQLLLPLNYLELPCPIFAEQIWKVSYLPTESAVFACTAEATPVMLTACEPVRTEKPPGTGGIKPGMPLCAWTQDASAIPWMEQIIVQAEPTLIVRYTYFGQGAYWFESARGNYLFDCQGALICKEEANSRSCLENPDLQERFVILVKNN